jgi:hypothetical protein
LVIEADPRHFRNTTPAMNDPMLPLPGLSPVSGKTVIAKFDGGLLSSDGGVLLLREAEQRLRVADRLAASMVDSRAPDQLTHSLADTIRFRRLMIGAGYEDGNDASSLRSDQVRSALAERLADRADARTHSPPKSSVFGALPPRRARASSSPTAPGRRV